VKQMLKRLLSIFSGALVGYIFGWILGWSSFDPNSDVWALAAFIGTGAGLVVGLSSTFWRNAGIFFGSTIGLYLGWLLRTLLFGDVPGGFGLLFVVSGATAGGVFGARPAFREAGVSLYALAGVLLIGFFGGFLVNAILINVIRRLQQGSLILWLAPGVIMSGIMGGFVGAKIGRKRDADGQ
jgi:hypothetical protein